MPYFKKPHQFTLNMFSALQFIAGFMVLSFFAGNGLTAFAGLVLLALATMGKFQVRVHRARLEQERGRELGRVAEQIGRAE